MAMHPTRPPDLGGARSLPRDDPERLGALLASLEPRLAALALRFTRDPESARDVVQNAFEKVIRNAARFEGQSLVSTWVHRIVANEALMWLRSERRRREIQRDPAEAGDPADTDARHAAGDAIDRRRALTRLRAAIARLGREEREVVEGCALAGLSYAEYGAAVGLRAGAVKSRAFRARRHLAEWMAADQEPDPRLDATS